MKLKYVTLTGADNTVTNPADLIALSAKYPFVEWAILFSQSKSSTSRYPSFDWVAKLLAAAEGKGVNLSAHLCGKWVEDAMGGNLTFLGTQEFQAFQRLQLNMGTDRLKRSITCQKLHEAIRACSKQVILGGNYRHIEVNAEFFLDSHLVPFFDASGGRGVLTVDWPKPFETSTGMKLFCGYAGGLGPDNIAMQLDAIAKVVDSKENPGFQIWIDMESSLRTRSKYGDLFDLEKCERVLELCSSWTK